MVTLVTRRNLDPGDSQDSKCIASIPRFHTNEMGRGCSTTTTALQTKFEKEQTTQRQAVELVDTLAGGLAAEQYSSTVQLCARRRIPRAGAHAQCIPQL